MQFNSEANSLDLVSDCKYWCGISSSDTTSYPLTDMARNANFALDRIHMLILTADGKWNYQDTNDASSPMLDTSTNLVSGTRRYAVPITWLKISRVRVKDAQGNWVTLRPRSRRSWNDATLNGDSGTPQEYDLVGGWIELDRAPNYASTGGLEVQLHKGPSYFASNDTTKTPGFAAPFHRLVSLYMALDYCEADSDLEKRATKIRNRIGRPPTEGDLGAGMEKLLVDHYAMRNIDNKPSLQAQREDYGQAGLVD